MKTDDWVYGGSAGAKSELIVGKRLLLSRNFRSLLVNILSNTFSMMFSSLEFLTTIAFF